MRIHGVTIAGAAVTVIGWLWLIFWSSVDTGGFGFASDRVFNLQLAAMAGLTIGLGYTLLIVGTLVSGFQWLKPEVVPAVSRDELNASPLRAFAKTATAGDDSSVAEAKPVDKAELTARMEAMRAKLSN